MFSAMLTDAFKDGDNSIPIRYRFDGFPFADDMAKDAPTEEKIQKGVDQVPDSCDSYDLTISIKKTEVVYQPPPGKPYHHSERSTTASDKFTYFGSTLSRVVHIDDGQC